MGSKQGSTTSTSSSAPWSAQQPYLQNLFGYAQNAYNQYGSNPQSYVAPLNANQNQAINMTQQAASGQNSGNVGSVNNAASNYVTNTANGAGLNSNPGNAAFSQFANGSMMNNPYMQGMANAAGTNIINQYQTATAPQTTSQFEGAGRYGSGAMMNQQNIDQQGLATQLGNAQNNLYGSMYNTNMGNMLSGAQGLSGNYNTAAQQQLGAASLAPGMAQSNLGTISALGNMGALQQSQQQALNQSPFTLAGQYQNLIGQNYGSSGSQTTPYYTNPLGQIAGIGLAGASLMSDRRLKENIRRIGQLPSGLPIYAYNYIGGGAHIGVMADEAKQMFPSAVTNVGGFDAVNYGELS